MNQGWVATDLGTAKRGHCIPAHVVTHIIEARITTNRTLSTLIMGRALQREVVRPRVERLDDRDVPERERRLAVGQVVAPLADEALVESQGEHVTRAGGEGLGPAAQGERVVGA